MTCYQVYAPVRLPLFEDRIRDLHSQISPDPFTVSPELSEKAAQYLLANTTVDSVPKLRALLCEGVAHPFVRVGVKEAGSDCLKEIEKNFRKTFLATKSGSRNFTLIGIAVVKVGRLINSIVLYGS
jgi:hypothetical protein